MSSERAKYLRFGTAIAVILISLGYLAYTGVEESKSYYVTISEMRQMGDDAYAKRLRVAGNVVPGSIKRQGTRVEFVLVEQGLELPIVYKGAEAPPDTLNDESQALAEGRLGRNGVFQANKLQAKCASKYAPEEQPGQTPSEESPAQETAAPRKTAQAR